MPVSYVQIHENQMFLSPRLQHIGMLVLLITTRIVLWCSFSTKLIRVWKNKCHSTYTYSGIEWIMGSISTIFHAIRDYPLNRLFHSKTHMVLSHFLNELLSSQGSRWTFDLIYKGGKKVQLVLLSNRYLTCMRYLSTICDTK